MGYLARREHSRAELKRKLLPHAEGDAAVVDALLDDFERRGWLSDERFAEVVVNSRQSARFGRLRIQHELRQKGVPDALIDAHLPRDRDAEMQLAVDALKRKYGKLADDLAGRARQMRFLQSRGFGMDVISRVLRADFELWDEPCDD